MPSHKHRLHGQERFKLGVYFYFGVALFLVTLFCLSSYLPDPYISDRLNQQSLTRKFKMTQEQTNRSSKKGNTDDQMITSTKKGKADLPVDTSNRNKEERRQKQKLKDEENMKTGNKNYGLQDTARRPERLPSLDEIKKSYNELGGNRDSCTIKHLGKSRDYSKFPVIVRAPRRDLAYEEDCDIPCLYMSSSNYPYIDASIKVIPGGSAIVNNNDPAVCSGHHQKVMMSMESVLNYPSLKRESLKANRYDIQAIYDLNSDVPVPYFSWAEYDIYKKPAEKTADAMVAMFISNCGGSNKRLEYVRELMKYGVTVHSYGKCMHNKDAPQGKSNRAAGKGDVVKNYKFTIAFENGNTENYVTEKLYGLLVEGTVPLHMGVSNVHDFAPEHSVISVHDFESPKELAEYLLMLDKDDAKYAEYLAWKDKPPSDKFKALMDLSNVHSRCRLCIYLGDKFTLNEYPPEEEIDGKAGLFYIRERGTYYFHPVELGEETVGELSAKALRILRPGGLRKNKYDKLKVWDMYLAYNKTQKIKSDMDINTLPPQSKIEVVII